MLIALRADAANVIWNIIAVFAEEREALIIVEALVQILSTLFIIVVRRLAIKAHALASSLALLLFCVAMLVT